MSVPGISGPFVYFPSDIDTHPSHRFQDLFLERKQE